MSAVERFSRIIHRSVLKIDPEAEWSTVNFARINYRLTWSGFPGDMNKITMVKRTIKRVIGLYFEKWGYSIKVSLKEQEDRV